MRWRANRSCGNDLLKLPILRNPIRDSAGWRALRLFVGPCNVVPTTAAQAPCGRTSLFSSSSQRRLSEASLSPRNRAVSAVRDRALLLCMRPFLPLSGTPTPRSDHP
ncbi:hypothetical protein HPB47_000495 [Ixodes persulcatus]|uniref:Uncharacterized protein n=1 Tax=Ixodes persulcatus TaxID=34615 RepID=A0AC60PRJ5_IXOPE|nr:hypothetical protein HPB47_000495 [Ixodes persulcatus]